METTTTCEVLHLNTMETVAQVDKNTAIVKGLHIITEEMGRLGHLDVDIMGHLDLVMVHQVVGLDQIGILQTVSRDRLLTKDRVSSPRVTLVFRIY
jgi:hypothetical protein